MTALIAAVVIGGTTFILSRRQRLALVRLSAERDNLAVATQAVQKRNDQFAALYQVVTEITDSLSMRYVASTTVKEAFKLARVDYTELRLLQGDLLVVRDGHSETDLAGGAQALALGVSLAGKAAKRGSPR